MSEMMERVASTMAGTYSVSGLKPEGRELWLVLARAAIEATGVERLREVLLEARDALEAGSSDTEVRASGVLGRIDAALSAPPEPETK